MPTVRRNNLSKMARTSIADFERDFDEVRGSFAKGGFAGEELREMAGIRVAHLKGNGRYALLRFAEQSPAITAAPATAWSSDGTR